MGTRVQARAHLVHGHPGPCEKRDEHDARHDDGRDDDQQAHQDAAGSRDALGEREPERALFELAGHQWCADCGAEDPGDNVQPAQQGGEGVAARGGGETSGDTSGYRVGGEAVPHLQSDGNEEGGERGEEGNDGK
jgi:hypothetical protein